MALRATQDGGGGANAIRDQHARSKVAGVDQSLGRSNGPGIGDRGGQVLELALSRVRIGVVSFATAAAVVRVHPEL